MAKAPPTCAAGGDEQERSTGSKPSFNKHPCQSVTGRGHQPQARGRLAANPIAVRVGRIISEADAGSGADAELA
jgi:hypothetical protein